MLRGKCAIVTGSSRGIGRAIAKKLASQGVNIVLNYRSNDEQAIEVENELKEFGVEVLKVKADISKLDEAEKLIKAAKERFNKIDIMVNNAGVTIDKLLIRMKEEDFDNVINVNLKGVFNCLKSIAPVMLRQKCGNIINISSVVGLTGNAGQVNYAASKAGVIGMTKSLAKELGSRGITVNAVAPGFIETDMTQDLNEEYKKKIQEEIPLKRFGAAEDVADVVSFLASDDAKYVTGQVIHVDGGMVM